MKQVSYIRDHPNYDEEYWNNFLENKIIQVIDAELKKYQNLEFVQLFDNTNNELINTRDEFKKNHNSFIMFFLFIGAIFGILLFIYPGILAIKKYKELNTKKRNYLSKIKEKETQKKLLINQFMEKINFNLIKEKILFSLNFNEFKPLSIEFLEEIDYLNHEHFQVIPRFNSYNPGNSSWSIFNNNIIIKKNNIEHKIIDKTYVGTRTVSKTVYVNGQSNIRTEQISSYYSHPCPIFSNDQRYLLYTDSIPELEFSYKGFSNKRIPKKHKTITLENELFYYRYNYSWNDDIQIRMFFTPFFMEQYLKINKELEPPLYLQLNKKSTFLYTNYKLETFNCDIQQCISTNLDNNLEEFQKYITNKYLIFARSQYQAIKFATLFPIIQSESHLYKLNNIQMKQKMNTRDSCYIQNIVFKIHYLLNEYFENSFSFNSKKSIHNVEKVELININQWNLIWSSIHTLTYDVIVKSIIQYEYSHLLNTPVSITIYYDDYLERNHKHNIAYFEIKNKNIYFLNQGKITNLSDEIIEKIKNIQDGCENLIDILIDKGYLIFLFKIQEDDKQEYFNLTNLETFKAKSDEISDLISSLFN